MVRICGPVAHSLFDLGVHRTTCSFSAYLVSGMLLSALSPRTILAVFKPECADGRVRADETLFGQLGVLRSVALKVKESAANERPAISRPARDAREVLKEMAADGEEGLVGIF